MLVLSRKVGEKLVIGDNITVVISRVAGNRVTVGIEAPSDVRVVRGELKPVADEFASREITLKAEPAPALSLATGGYDRAADTANASVPRLAK